MNKIIGTVVLTDYNNKTYRIDNVDWDKNPNSTFDYRGEQKSFVEYYQRYNITIRDMDQPLLESRPRERDVRAGRQEPVLLIPELCRSTGKIYI